MNVLNRKPPTAQQIIAQQQRGMATPRFGEPPPSTAITAAKPSVPAVPDSRTAVQAYLDEVAPVSIVGRMVKFNSKGSNFITSDDEAAIDEGAEFVVLCDQTLVGWLKFNNEAPPDRVMGLLYDGFVMPPRTDLGDMDQADWPTGLDGKPADPWQHHMYLVLQSTDTAELFTFVSSSATGRRAVGNLLHHYNRMQRTNPDELPVVSSRLAASTTRTSASVGCRRRFSRWSDEHRVTVLPSPTPRRAAT